MDSANYPSPENQICVIKEGSLSFITFLDALVETIKAKHHFD